MIQNFCITPNAIHPDLEVSLQRTNAGFDAYRYYYILTYKNKGTHTQSGTISMAFDDNLQDFELSTPGSSTSTTNLVTWNFSDLKPFETRTIQIQFIMNLGTTLHDIIHVHVTGMFFMPTETIMVTPVPMMTAMAKITILKKRPSAACMSGIRCGGGKMAMAAGRRQNSAKIMPPTQVTTASRCMNSMAE